MSDDTPQRLSAEYVADLANGTIEGWLQGYTDKTAEVPLQHRVRLQTDGNYRFEPQNHPGSHSDLGWPEQFFRILVMAVEDDPDDNGPGPYGTPAQRASWSLKDRAASIMSRDDLSGPAARADIEAMVRIAYVLAALLDSERIALTAGRVLRHLRATNHPATDDFIQLIGSIDTALHVLDT